MHQRIIDWIANNEPTIYDICKALHTSKAASYTLYSVEYHEDISKQYKEKVLSGVCDVVCRDLGCSTEQFYETVEGTEDKWIFLALE